MVKSESTTVSQDPMKKTRIAKLSLLVAIGGIGAILVFLLYRSQHTAGKYQEPRLPPRVQSSDRSAIRGLRYSVNMGAEARLTIEADEFRVGKKKIGFLRVSLLDEAEIRNARIRIIKTATLAPSKVHPVPQETASQPSSEQTPQPSVKGDPGKEPSNLLMDSARAVLREIETSKAFPGMSSAKIVAVKIAPIDLQIYEGNTPLLKISAGNAGFDLKHIKTVLRESVHASAGEESWTGDELSIDPGSGSVKGKRNGGAPAQEDLSRVFYAFTEGSLSSRR
jgi:hypothetical protein